MATSVRQPAVAGQFYPSNSQKLRSDVESYVAASRAPAHQPKLRAKGAVVPHAGYMYSGAVAGAVYARLQLPKRFVILCPNHTGMGEPLAIMSEGKWRTPLGAATIDTEMAYSLKHHMNMLCENEEAHEQEHALEVQLPFLQTLVPDFKFVPITVGVRQYDILSALGVAIAHAMYDVAPDAMVLASSDMNHYEPDDVTRVKDQRAIDRVLELDPEGLYKTIHDHHITMCGFGPTVAMLVAARMRGATKAELIRYATSADVSGDKSWCVGYAGIAVL